MEDALRTQKDEERHLIRARSAQKWSESRGNAFLHTDDDGDNCAGLFKDVLRFPNSDRL